MEREQARSKNPEEQGRALGTHQEVDLSQGVMPSESAANLEQEQHGATRSLHRILQLCESFLVEHPERAKELLGRCEELAKLYGPPESSRTLNVSQASRVAEVSRARLHELHRGGRLGERIDGDLRFSEEECINWRDNPETRRKP